MGAVTTDLVGVGLYSLGEAAKLLRVSRTKLRNWADGYSFEYRGEEHASEPIFRRDLAEAGLSDLLTFADLIELLFISRFRSEGVSMPVIRAAAERAAELYQTDHPFAAKCLKTDGRVIFAILESRKAQLAKAPYETLVEEMHRRQLVFPALVEPYFRNIEYDVEEAVRYWPRGREGGVVLDPKRAFGKPIDAETGVPTLVLYRAVEAGDSIDDVAYWYDIPRDAVRRAVEYEGWLRAA